MLSAPFLNIQNKLNNVFETIKTMGLKGAYWIGSNSSFIQYCDSNIGLFSIAPSLVIALPTLR